MNELVAPLESTTTVETGNTSNLVSTVKSAVENALQYKGKLSNDVLNLEGMSGKKYRYFINNVVERVENPNYLEIGSWAGSTFCSAIHKNSVRATAIDNWSQFGGPIGEFFKNLSNNCSSETRITVITDDFRNVRYELLGKFNIYLFDGPHEYKDQYDALTVPFTCLDNEFIFIVDDWNFDWIRNGTLDAIKKLNLGVLYQVEIRTSLDNSHPKIARQHSDWHNGYFISVLQKPAGAG